MDRHIESELFNQMVDYYDDFRPDYPNEIVNSIINKAKLISGSRLLEIGSGSGKATKQFSEFGFEILCLDPGVDLVSKGNQEFKGKNIKFVASRFEDYSAPEDYFDAIFSAQAFHWIPQPLGYKKCAELLKKDGYLAVFWNIDIFTDGDMDKELYTILEKYSGFVSCSTEEIYKKRMKSITNGFIDSYLFLKPEIIHSCWEKDYSAKEYFDYLLTSQVFIQNNDEVKKACLKELELFASRYNGIINRMYTCELYITQKI